ncbi:thiol-disulfide oxidoreductase DCC family protein [Halobacillus litoralis]|uniref:thiol-disulfide oxidoreductase DCC family protein n=1 Tax=Halobacillus litoralis TaxID=45668 RepID=UPI001CD61FA5|nr:thiol-disulfide oxidoreductase DCC family protein [Halobacillus litoralis]MCA0972065.1 thiol-disulfide oxidoreductase DCC family protein [Halobacillus litoralis]
MKRIILFDGDCHFCDRSVQFIMKRDPKAMFQFASLQSETGQELLRKFGAPVELDSFILIEKNRMYTQSTAALRVCRQLNGLWKTLHFLTAIPKPIRDTVYNVIAKNRYKWFGTKEQCPLPTPDERKRFLS